VKPSQPPRAGQTAWAAGGSSPRTAPAAGSSGHGPERPRRSRVIVRVDQLPLWPFPAADHDHGHFWALRGCRAAAWLAIGPRFGLSAATRALGSRPQSCHLPVRPRGYSHFGQAGIFVEFMGLVEYLVHYRSCHPNAPTQDRSYVSDLTSPANDDKQRALPVTGALPSRSRGCPMSRGDLPAPGHSKGELSTRESPTGPAECWFAIAIISSANTFCSSSPVSKLDRTFSYTVKEPFPIR
jgi:hypothetical protein